MQCPTLQVEVQVRHSLYDHGLLHRFYIGASGAEPFPSAAFLDLDNSIATY